MDIKKRVVFLCSMFFSVAGLYSVNRLKRIEVCLNRFAPQLFLDFSGAFYFEKKVDLSKSRLDLVFPALKIIGLSERNIISELKKMKDLVDGVEILHFSKPSPRTVLRIKFIHNDVLLRWNKLESPSRLIVDFFRKSRLD